ncbi:MAG: hypothetical protein QXJ74_00820 [Nitrososphaera sp.]|uniref:hypothetical protein n=1 Tax=Nitrososphaera sp. TaxID=1971748 RepID=UPI00185D2D9C|nr:hypothetical protein [Nitrososphaera sp.]NWG37478.1 hypothetical protein [Nitrososphaera sp.]
MESPDIERKLSGRTLQVYLYLQRKKEPAGIREVQRDLGLSSPSVADYQIEKLAGMGLVSKDRHGRVFVTRKVRVKALDSYVNFGRFSVPRLAFYASVFSAVAVLYAAFNISNMSIYGVAVPAAAAAVLWVEAWRMWRFSLIERAQNAKAGERQTLLHMLAPGIAAVAVFVAAGGFLSQYSQQSSLVPAPVAPYDWEASRPTLEESAEISHEKVVAAGSPSGIAEPVMTGLLFSAAVVMGFVAYVVARYRSAGRVLEPEQAHDAAS